MLTVHAYTEDDNRRVQHYILLVPLVAELLLNCLPLLVEEGGDGSRKAQLRVDLADPRIYVQWWQTSQ